MNGEEKELELVEHEDKNWYGENNFFVSFFHVFQNKISKEQQHFSFFQSIKSMSDLKLWAPGPVFAELIEGKRDRCQVRLRALFTDEK